MLFKTTALTIPLDEESHALLSKAADLRRISVSDYARKVALAQARRDLAASEEQLIALTPTEQLVFWTALCDAPRLSKAQRELGRIMRGET